MKHRAWVEVDLQILRENLRGLAEIVAPAKVAAVVKSEAYGHGLVPVALALESEDIWGVCVVTPSEGIRLREAGFQKNILVVGACFPEEMKEAIKANITLAAYDLHQAQEISGAAVTCATVAKVHLKLDTGLSRLAVTADKAAQYYAAVKDLPNLEIEGIYSHLADAEGLDQTYTLHQYRQFGEALMSLEAQGFEPKLRHIGASAASLLLQQTRLNLVRTGISLYGYWPSEETRILYYGASNDLKQRLQDEFLDQPQPTLIDPFKPALSYRCRVIQTKWIPPMTKVGYGCTFETQRKTRIAVLPVGYAEGYDRHLSNCGEVLLCGRKARILGRVCMNLTVVDITDIADVEQGSVATLIGCDGESEITVEQVAAKIGTINYEVVTRIPESIPRVYA